LKKDFTVLYSKQRLPQQKQKILKVHKGNGKSWHLVNLKIGHINGRLVDEAGKEGPYHEGFLV